MVLLRRRRWDLNRLALLPAAPNLDTVAVMVVL